MNTSSTVVYLMYRSIATNHYHAWWVTHYPPKQTYICPCVLCIYRQHKTVVCRIRQSQPQGKRVSSKEIWKRLHPEDVGRCFDWGLVEGQQQTVSEMQDKYRSKCNIICDCRLNILELPSLFSGLPWHPVKLTEHPFIHFSFNLTESPQV